MPGIQVDVVCASMLNDRRLRFEKEMPLASHERHERLSNPAELPFGVTHEGTYGAVSLSTVCFHGDIHGSHSTTSQLDQSEDLLFPRRPPLLH